MSEHLRRAALKLVLESPEFTSSRRASEFLRYVCEATFQGRSELDQAEIARDLLVRGDEFNPIEDASVRKLATLVRQKLDTYYAGKGRDNPVIIQIPPRSYLPRFQARPEPESTPDSARSRRRWRLAGWGIAACAAVTLSAALGYFAGQRQCPASGPHVRRFWNQVLSGKSRHLLVFSNPRAVGTLLTSGLRAYDEKADSAFPERLNLTYTGSGNVHAVASLVGVFDQLQKRAEVRSGALLSWDEAKEANLIFLGRAEQNAALQQLPRLSEFYFKRDVGIVDAHPKPGNPTIYAAGPRPYTYDYGVIAYMPSLAPSWNIVILAGATTYATQAAANFVSNESDMAALLSELHVESGQKIPFFECLIEVKVNRDVPISTRIKFVRVRPPGLVSWQPADPREG